MAARRGSVVKPAELRQRVIATINKLSDRDTYQIACKELESVVASLSPECFGIFLVCIYETDTQQKSTVRKECVRLLGAMARAHGDLLSPHLSRMVGNLVKRLKDPDSNVRDACVEAIGIMASSIKASPGGCLPFAVFVKPLLECLGEQNRHLQVGCALCLSKVIDNIDDTPQPAVLHRLLPKLIKLLNNRNYAGKGGLLTVLGSVAQAGGAASQQALGMIVPAMQNALRSSEWATRRAASEAFCRLALSSRDALSPFKASCLSCLDSCRFDKVKPVRDSIVQTLQAWKNVPDSVGQSATPESLCRENLSEFPVSKNDTVSISNSNNSASRCPPDAISTVSIKKTPTSGRKTNRTLLSKKVSRKVDDWHIQVSVPQTNTDSIKASENTEPPRTSDFDTKCIVIDQCSAVKGPVEVDNLQKGHMNNVAMVNCAKSCKVQDTNEFAQIRKQLAQIETQQSNLLDLVKFFMGSSQESMRSLESRVHGLERMVDEMAQDLALSIGRLSSVNGSNVTCCKFPGSDFLSSKFWKRNEGRCSDGSSLNKFGRSTTYKDDFQVGERYRGMFGIVNPLADSRRTSSRERFESVLSNEGPKTNIESSRRIESRTGIVDMSKHSEASSVRSVWKSSRDEPTLAGTLRTRKDGDINDVDYRKENSKPYMSGNVNDRSHFLSSEPQGSTPSVWSHAVEYLRTGDINAAFVEVLRSGDDLLLIKLMNRTGVVLEKLRKGTIVEIVHVLMQCLTKQKHLESITPWLKQILDWSTSNGPDYLALYAQVKKDSLSTSHNISLPPVGDASIKKTVTHSTSTLSTIEEY